MLLDANFRAKLCDFGLSTKVKKVGIAGTPTHMSPELLRGDTEEDLTNAGSAGTGGGGAFPPSRTALSSTSTSASTPLTDAADAAAAALSDGRASDVYSFGILLSECFSRQEPYHGQDLREALAAVADADRWPPHRPFLPPSVPAVWEQLIRQCWHPTPEARPTFTAIAAQLEDGLPLAEAITSLTRGSNAASGGTIARLPPRIAALLAEGKQVNPQAFDCISVFFCGVAGFTALAKKLDGHQVGVAIFPFDIRFSIRLPLSPSILIR